MPVPSSPSVKRRGGCRLPLPSRSHPPRKSILHDHLHWPAGGFYGPAQSGSYAGVSMKFWQPTARHRASSATPRSASRNVSDWKCRDARQPSAQFASMWSGVSRNWAPVAARLLCRRATSLASRSRSAGPKHMPIWTVNGSSCRCSRRQWPVARPIIERICGPHSRRFWKPTSWHSTTSARS